MSAFQVSPRYLAGRTPEHIKKKVIELLYVWSKEQNAESKVVEAYNMLKKQGIVKEDPGKSVEFSPRLILAFKMKIRKEAILSDVC